MTARTLQRSASQPPAAEPPESAGGRSAVFQLATLLGFAVAAVVLWRAASVVVVAFAGVLLAIALRGLADLLQRHARLPRGASLPAAVLTLLTLLGLTGWLVGDTLSGQFQELGRRLPETFEKLRAWLDSHPVTRGLVGSLGNADGVESVRRIAGAAATTLGALGNVLIILALGVYLAVDPGVYRRGVLNLVPAARRGRVARALDAAGDALRKWLGGQLIAMIAVGFATGLGLWLLGVPFALSLGVIAGVLEFVAFIGPVFAAVPAVLIGFADSPTTALHVVLLYLGVQQLENYVLMPLVQRWAVALPPAVAILAVVVLGVLIGLPGVLFGVPLVVAMLAVAEALREGA